MSTTSTEEGEFVVPQDGQKLYTKTWKASGKRKAIVIFIHGYSDHCNAYFDFFPALASKEIEVRSFDQRGWGKSVKKSSEKGLTGPTSKVLSDITEFLKTCLPSPAPLFLMGHSMGGGEVLHWIADPISQPYRKYIRGYLLEAPFISFHPASKPWPITVIAGRMAGKLLPRHQMVNKLDARLLSRSAEVQKAFEEDPLCHHTGTLEGLAGLVDRAGDLDNGKIKLPVDAGEGGRLRIWIAHGTADGVCGYDGTKKFFDHLPAIEDKEFKTYDGWSHKLHGEPSPDRETFAIDAASWMLSRCEVLGSSAANVRSKL